MADNNVGVRAGGVIVSSAPGLPTGYADELQGGVHQVETGGRDSISAARRTNGLIAIEPGGAWILDNGTWRSFLQWQHQNVPDLSQLQDTPNGIIVTLANGELRRISLNHFRELVGGLDDNTGGVVYTNEVAIITEVTMVAPNIVAITVRDPPYTKHPIRQLPASLPADPENTLYYENNFLIEGQWGRVLGDDRNWFKPYDIPPSERLDRELLNSASGYGGFGDLHVIESCYKAIPYDSVGFQIKEDLGTGRYSSFEYQVYLILSGPLPQGEYTITWPSNMLPPTAFTFDDKITRCSAIHTNHNGHRPNDRSKWACISQWLPRRYYGNIRYIETYGLEEFHIIDNTGTIVATYPAALYQFGGHSVDFGLGPGDYAGQESYAQIGNGPIRITETLTETSFVVPGCNWEIGQRVIFQFMNAFDDVGFGSGDILNILRPGASNATVFLDPETIEYPNNFDNSPRHWPISLLNGEAKMWRAIRGGASFCDVTELDFSDFTPANNTTYRLYIPNMGVSDPIEFNTNKWDNITRVVSQAYYNQRSGCAIEDRFGTGYTRPVAFAPDSRNKIRLSRCPGIFYFDGSSGIGIEEKETSFQHWEDTSFNVPSTWIGGHMDAGDWDVNAFSHLGGYLTSIMAHMLNRKYEVSARNYNLPRSSAVLGSEYAGTDSMSDLLHEVAYGMHFYRVTQAANGGIRAGVNIIQPNFRPGSCPSWLWPGRASIPAPDYICSYYYACVGAVFSRVLRDEGFTNLADIYIDSATAAWNYAQAATADLDTAYAEFVSIATSLGIFANQSWASIRDGMAGQRGENIPNLRLFGAMGLYYATGGSTYRDIVEAPSEDPPIGENTWKNYIPFFQEQVVGHNAAQVADRKQWVYNYLVYQSEPITLNYPILKDRRVPGTWGLLALPSREFLTSLILVHEWYEGDEEHPFADLVPKKIQDCLSHYMGANQLGKTLIHKVGYRWATEPTFEDTIYSGRTTFPGIPIYGWHKRDDAMMSQNWLMGYEWSALPQFGPNSDDAVKRRIYPPITHSPLFETLYAYPYVIPQQEFTIHQRHASMILMTTYLNCLDT